MAFERGAINFRLFLLKSEMPDDAVERFNHPQHRAQPLKDLPPDGVVNGWVGGRHLLDLPIKEENAVCGGFLKLHWLEAKRKIPASLLRAECLMEELLVMQAENKAFLPRKVRQEIKRSVTERLLPDMPPQLSGLPFVCRRGGDRLYAGALSVRQMEIFPACFRRTTGVDPVPMTPEMAAAARCRVDVRTWYQTSFAPDVPDSEVAENPGLDFLTWLWFFSEERGGQFKPDSGAPFAVALDGPLVFYMEGNGAHETVLRKGVPLISVEARTALMSGKKLRKARITLARGEEIWQAAVDAETFGFRSLKLPPAGEKLDLVSDFEDRMEKVDVFCDVFYGLFDRFVKERESADKWKATLKDIRRWIQERPAKV